MKTRTDSEVDKNLITRAYFVLANQKNQWVGRSSDISQQLLCNLRDRISEMTNIPGKSIQDAGEAGMITLMPMMEEMANS